MYIEKKGVHVWKIQMKKSSIPDGFPDIPQDLFDWFYKFSETSSELKEYEHCMEFINVSQMFEEWKSWTDFYDDESMNDPERFKSEPDGAVRRVYCNRNWVPIARDSGGNYIGIDLDPDENGVYGQIINFGRDERTKYVFADSIKEFYDLLTESKEELSASSHLTDGLIRFLYTE